MFATSIKKAVLLCAVTSVMLILNIGFIPVNVDARSQRAIVADMCETAIAAAEADGNSPMVIMLSGVDINGNPIADGRGNSLCDGRYSENTPDEVTEIVNDSLCDEIIVYTTQSLCTEYDEWLAGGGDTDQDKKDDDKANKDRKNSIQGPMDVICNILKTENPGLYNSAAFCKEQANSGLKESSLQSFCNMFDTSSEGGNDTIKQACKEAFRKGYINKEFKTNDDSQTPEDIDCEKGGVMGWILCPVFELGANVTSDAFESVIKPMLENIPVSTNQKDPFYKAWSNFRILGDIVLVGAMLVLVYGQIRGGGR